MIDTQGPAAPPRRHRFSEDSDLATLVRNVRDAIGALPAYFQTATRIEGLDAADLFSLNSVLGGAIEVQVVETLNRIRAVWDPDSTRPRHRFVRTSQTFPDVRLVARNGDGSVDVALGIELKGWYLLSKEREPSFRYTVTPAACAPQDLLVVVPWHLRNVLSGEPVVYAPYIEQARYAAEYRNWWWETRRETRDTSEQRKISIPQGNVRPYPDPKTPIADRAVKDRGSNFGRMARLAGLMDDYTESMRDQHVAGIPAEHWISFFRLHAETKDAGAIMKHLTKELSSRGLGAEAARDVADSISRIVGTFC